MPYSVVNGDGVYLPSLWGLVIYCFVTLIYHPLFFTFLAQKTVENQSDFLKLKAGPSTLV
jgi:hypothetical protein